MGAHSRQAAQAFALFKKVIRTQGVQMRWFVLLIVGLTASTPAAFAQSAGEKTGVNAVLGVAPKTVDFIAEAAANALFVTQSSQLALSKTERRVKEFAQHLVDDRSKIGDKLKTFAEKASVPFPTQTSRPQQKMLEQLAALNGDDFTQQYLDDEVAALKSDAALFTRYSKGGDNAEIKSWAAQTLPALQKQLEDADGLDKSPN
jgi:putative membrane protein